MDRLKQFLEAAVVLAAMGFGGSAWAQAAPAQQGSGAKPPAATPPLRLHSLAPDAVADPFPPANLKFFTADSPTAATVDAYLHALLGYNPTRIWRVMAIQKTDAPGVSKVTALVSEKVAGAKVQTATFYVMPDGKHLIADANSGVLPFGADPYMAARALLQARADGPSQGPASKDLMLVEFSDLQCPHCKEAEPTMKRLAEDFPKARIVYESFPLVDIHPYAFKAAAYGVCVAKKSSAAYLTYADAVYATQTQLTAETADKTLDDAAAKAGADPTAIATCAASAEAKNAVEASLKLGAEVGVDQTPILVVNGRLLPLGGIPYETLKQIVIFQATLDGASTAAATPSLTGASK
jgi:protein-disulfide isomerase